MRRALILCLPLLLMACNSVVETSNVAAEMTHSAFNDSVDHWRNVFTYTPKPQPQGPQTRYCYKMQTDVVCYDSVQPEQTSRLVGYQDGDQISWVQPGGGSLGASGGAPTAARMSNTVQSSPTTASLSLATSSANTNFSGSSGIAVSDTLPPAAPTVIANPSPRVAKPR